MTRVRYDRAGLRMRMEGHAGAGEYGRDIVCAAESILLLVLERQLQELEGENRVSVVKRPGAAEISCCPARERNRMKCTASQRKKLRMNTSSQ